MSRKQCRAKPAVGAFTVGKDYTFKIKSDSGGGYLVNDDKGVEIRLPNSICFSAVGKSGKVSSPPVTIPRGYSPSPLKVSNDGI